MKIELAKMERMSERGSSLLRLIQNSHTPLLDLLVRESVQNSLDAAQGERPIKYDISVKQFNKYRVSRHFEGITESLNNKFQDSAQESIVIRDTNTTGLTGPLHQDYIKNDHYGNLLKLVYEISMPQEKREAGGSWGLGKTVYFRAGSGLVIYYSRIKDESGNYQSRLAACLVEDESKEDALLPDNGTGRKRGIAWWGEQHSESSTQPVTNEQQIREILQDLNVNPYIDDETGTTIIIPYINKNDLIVCRDDYSDSLWWHNDLELYLNIALQKWYAPRIDNPWYRYGNYLLPSVGGRPVTRDSMEPLFSIMRNLYIAAIADNKIAVNKIPVNVRDIKIYRTLENPAAGKVAFIKVSKETLKMTIPDNKKSPYEYLDLETNNDGKNKPIIAYLRKPAMIINYETDSKWTSNIEQTSTDDYIIGLFVPNSVNVISKTDPPASLDEYIRQGEKADHSSWSDITVNGQKQTIIERIQKKVSESVRNEYNKDSGSDDLPKSSALSRSIAKALLPPRGFGFLPGIGSDREKKKNSIPHSVKSGSLNILDTHLSGEGVMAIKFECDIPARVKSLHIETLVDSENNKRINGDKWEGEEEIGTRFPVEIKKVMVKSPVDSNITYRKTGRFQVVNVAEITLIGFIGKLDGTIFMVNHDPSIQAVINEKIEKVGS
ncbi:hypothetical protein [Sporolactobacillus sp. THM19-2]|uniref:hypothetical protein n=1 Tax=Sporolactobacillus sp. THM19-2 TaxID=2511171 RepID=UPI001021F8D5|nr:hypothetical protein [Sporolactobacillus sp. THM19-2]RYL92397.1 hypothetical protein EWH91_07610 [Sporolactobacillus sp. THM19-2]